MKKVVIYYFTGCGNSRWVAQTTAAKFQEKNTEAIAINIEGRYISQNADIVGFVFPIYSFGLPKFAVDFLKNYPSRKNQRVFIFTVPAMHEGIGLLQANLMLSKKECDVLYGRSIYMPDSWVMFFDAPGENKFADITGRAEQDIEKTVRAIIAGDRNLAVPNPVFLPILGAIYGLFYGMGRHLLGKCFAITNKCNSCRVCYDSCPSKTIIWTKQNKPYWNFGCHQCYRCINKCPKGAIEVSVVPVVVMFLTFIFGFKFYSVIMPDSIEKLLSVFWIFPKLVFWFILNYVVMWVLHDLGMKNIMPDIFFTSKKRRYKRLMEQHLQQQGPQ